MRDIGNARSPTKSSTSTTSRSTSASASAVDAPALSVGDAHKAARSSLNGIRIATLSVIATTSSGSKRRPPCAIPPNAVPGVMVAT